MNERAPLGRFGTMNETTGIIVFLSSDYASFFHSSIIHADGGQSKHYMSDTFLNNLKMKLTDTFAKIIKSVGIKNVFGLQGGAVVHFLTH